MLHTPTESNLRDLVDEMTIDQWILWEKYSTDFLRQFADKVDWEIVFRRMYEKYVYECAVLQGSYLYQHSRYRFQIESFKQWLKNYNEKFFNEYFKDKEDLFK